MNHTCLQGAKCTDLRRWNPQSLRIPFTNSRSCTYFKEQNAPTAGSRMYSLQGAGCTDIYLSTSCFHSGFQERGNALRSIAITITGNWRVSSHQQLELHLVLWEFVESSVADGRRVATGGVWRRAGFSAVRKAGLSG